MLAERFLEACKSLQFIHVSSVLLTLQDFANSLAPETLGFCQGDLARLSKYLNQAIQQLNAANSSGWWGGWAKMVFNVTRNDPFVTVPSIFARIAAADVCRMPVRVQNEWYEFLEAGIGLREPCDGIRGCGAMEGYERGVWSTAYDLTPTNQKLRVRITDARDIGKRILFQNAKDQNGNGIYTQDVNYPVIGFYLAFNQPFVDSSMIVSSFSSVQKDQTFGDVTLHQVDQTTGAEVLLARYTPDETSPQYRRYYFNRLPNGCCTLGEPTTPAQITVMAKYEFRPVSRPTDRLLISNIPALIDECNSIRHKMMDDPTAKALGIQEHKEAIKKLNDELKHYLGDDLPAINVAPWGTARLGRQAIGSMM